MSTRKNVLKDKPYTFKADINKVFGCLNSTEILKKIGIIHNYSLSPDRPFGIGSIEKVDCILPIKMKVEFEIVDVVVEQNYKTYVRAIRKINGKQIPCEIRVQYSLFFNTCDHSTIFLREIYSIDSKDNFLHKYLCSFPDRGNFLYCDTVSRFIESWNKPVKHIESILIQRSPEQIFSLFKDFEEILFHFYQRNQTKICKQGKGFTEGTQFFVKNQKKKDMIKYTIEKILNFGNIINIQITKEKKIKKVLNFSIVQISPISSYVLIENEIPFYLQDRHINFISKLYQAFLNSIRNKVEHSTAIQD